MDLLLLGRVIWNQKIIVLVGVIVGLAAAVFSAYQVSNGELVERTSARYQSNIRLLVTDLPAFQSQDLRQLKDGQQIVHGLAVAQLAGTYPYLITSNDIRDKVAARIGVPATAYDVDAFRRTVAPNTNQNATLSGDNSLPIVEIRATADTPALAEQVVWTTAQTFIELVIDQQNVAKLPPEERISVQTLGSVSKAEQIGNSPLVLQVLVFSSVATVFLALAFARYNVRVARRSENRPENTEELETVENSERAADVSTSVSTSTGIAIATTLPPRQESSVESSRRESEEKRFLDVRVPAPAERIEANHEQEGAERITWAHERTEK